MSRLHLSMLTIIAVLAFGAVAAASAFAVELTFELAEWLVSGAKILEGEKLAVEASGGFTFKNEGNGATMLCEGIADGTVEADGKGTTTELLNTAKELLGGLTGLGVACLGSGTCLSDAEAWGENLPWEGLLELDVQDGTFWGLVVGTKLPIFHMKCLTIIGTQEEECLAVTGAGGEALNLATDVEGMGLAEPLADCGGGIGNGDVTADAGNLGFLSSGLSLQVSE